MTLLGFPGGSEVKASAWNAGDPGSIPQLGRSPGPTRLLCPWDSQARTLEWVNFTQMTIISTTVGWNPLEDMEQPSQSTKESEYLIYKNN